MQIANLPEELQGAAINSSMSQDEVSCVTSASPHGVAHVCDEQVSATKTRLLEGKVDLLFVSPEALQSYWLVLVIVLVCVLVCYLSLVCIFLLFAPFSSTCSLFYCPVLTSPSGLKVC